MDTITRTDLQLQLWDSDLRAYVPAPSDAVRTRSWRLVDPAKNRATKNPKHSPPRYGGHSRTILEVRAQYLQWARERGLAVCDWEHNRYKALASNADRFVHRDKYFDVEHTEDPS